MQPCKAKVCVHRLASPTSLDVLCLQWFDCCAVKVPGVHRKSAANRAVAHVWGAIDLQAVGCEAGGPGWAAILEVVELHKVDSH